MSSKRKGSTRGRGFEGGFPKNGNFVVNRSCASILKAFNSSTKRDKFLFTSSAELTIIKLKQKNPLFFNRHLIEIKKIEEGAIGNPRDLIYTNFKHQSIDLSCKIDNYDLKHQSIDLSCKIDNYDLKQFTINSNKDPLNNWTLGRCFLDNEEKRILKEAFMPISGISGIFSDPKFKSKVNLTYEHLTNWMFGVLNNRKDDREFIERFFKFIFSTGQYYKVILNSRAKNPYIKLYYYNMDDIKLPTKIEKIYTKVGPINNVLSYIIIKFNNNCFIKLRIHSKATKIENSMRFTVTYREPKDELFVAEKFKLDTYIQKGTKMSIMDTSPREICDYLEEVKKTYHTKSLDELLIRFKSGMSIKDYGKTNGSKKARVSQEVAKELIRKLADGESVDISQIIKNSKCSSSTVSRAIKSLENNGSLKRVGNDIFRVSKQQPSIGEVNE